jgi:hypothetical protein
LPRRITWLTGAALPGKDDVALINVGTKYRVDVLGRGRLIKISQFDRRLERSNSFARRCRRRAGQNVLGKPHADFRLSHRLRPGFHVHQRAGLKQCALHQITNQRCLEAKLLHRRRRAEGHLPAERRFARRNALAPALELRRHAACDALVVPWPHLWLSGCTW